MSKLLTYNQEVYRKLIHISSSLIALFLWYFGKDTFLPWIISVAIIFPILDYARKKITLLKNIYFILYGIVTRPQEHYTLSGASWVFIGAGITTIFFNEKVAVIAILIMSLSDSAAALIGIKYGKTQYFNKSLEGSLAFFITTYIILFIFSSATPSIILFISVVATAFELFSQPKLNDNLIIPIGTALIMTLGGIS